MSTQQAPAIDFSLAQNFAHFRLVELPDEIVQLLSSDPGQILELKSDAASGTAVVCSQTQSFPVRSVQTSNSLFVIQPVVEQGLEDNAIPCYGIRAVAVCNATLELTKMTSSAIPYLQRVLPEYSTRDINFARAQKNTYQSLSEDIPLSNAEIRAAWNLICAFEHQESSFRPTASILLELWKAIMTASFAENIDLEKAFLCEDLWSAVKDEDFPKPLFNALLDRIADSSATDKCKESNTWTTIDQELCTAWVASLILETNLKPGQALEVCDFETIWRDSVFEKWRHIASLSLIQNMVIYPNAGAVALKADHRLSGASTAASLTGETSMPTKTRKWHDKFRKGRT